LRTGAEVEKIETSRSNRALSDLKASDTATHPDRFPRKVPIKSDKDPYDDCCGRAKNDIRQFGFDSKFLLVVQLTCELADQPISIV
jgi:hypothetical protein